jgi:putative ABC transport system permease protein
VRGLARDLRLAARSLLHSPGFTLLVVATLTLGIGANTAIFALVNETLLRPLPFHEPDRLVFVWDRSPDGASSPMSPPAWKALATRTDVFESVSGSTDAMYNLTGVGEPESIVGYRFGPAVFGTLGVSPALGRVFTADENRPGGEHVVVLSHRLWQRKFGGDPSVVGRSVTLSGHPYTIVGVMPPGVVHPPGVELWTPLALPEGTRDDGRLRFVRVVARLRPGVSLEAAKRAVSEVSSRLSKERPDAVRGGGLVVEPLDNTYRGDARAPLAALAGAVAFVLLVACANVAGLGLARAIERRHAFAVRVALGAGRTRLVREALVEAAIPALAGGALGLALAFQGVDLLPTLFPQSISNLNLPRVETVTIDLRVLVFTVVVSMLAALLSGLVPALVASATDPGETLKGASRGVASGRSRLPSLLVAGEVALAVVLLVGASLLLRSFLHLRGSSLGFDPHHVLTARILPPDYKYGDPQKLAAFHDAVLERVKAVPGVEAAGSVTFLPLSGWGGPRAFRLQGEARPAPGQEKEAEFGMIDPGYLRAMRIPLVAGRGFDDRDRAQAPKVVLVNETFVRRYLAEDAPGAIGKRILLAVRLKDADAPPLREIVGVVGDVHQYGLERPVEPQMYLPYAQEPVGLFCLAARTKGAPRALGRAISEAVWKVDPDQAVGFLMPLDDLAAQAEALRRVSTLLVGAFAALALGLAALGVYGVVAQAVARRTREIGLRMALGARPTAVIGDVLWRSLGLAALGALVGVLGSLAVARLLRGLLLGVTPADPVAFAAAAACLLAAAGIAGYLPARRASRVDPAAVLREP